ncbi:MAG: hypothetical protein ACLR43_13080 [Faecalibacillus faecis]
MKYKDVLRNSLYLDEELQDYFNEMSKKDMFRFCWLLLSIYKR